MSLQQLQVVLLLIKYALHELNRLMQIMDFRMQLSSCMLLFLCSILVPDCLAQAPFFCWGASPPDPPEKFELGHGRLALAPANLNRFGVPRKFREIREKNQVPALGSWHSGCWHLALGSAHVGCWLRSSQLLALQSLAVGSADLSS